MFHYIMHCLWRHDIANGCKTSCGRLSNDSELATESQFHDFESFSQFWPHIWMESGNDSFKDAKRVYDILAELFLNA